MYPEYIELNGTKYKINTDYRVALSCFKAIKDKQLDNFKRLVAVCTLLLGDEFPIELMPAILDKVAIYLRCGKKENPSSDEIDMDYFQDMKYIVASFYSCYHIDIEKEEMHWWKFNELMVGFGEDEALTRVREIRNAKTSDIKDKKALDRLIKAKEAVALEIEDQMTDEQREAHNRFDDLVFGKKGSDKDEK